MNYIDVSSFRKGEILDINGNLNIAVPVEYMVTGGIVKTAYSGEILFDGEVYSLSLNVDASFYTPCARCLKETEVKFLFLLTEAFEKTALDEGKIDLQEALAVAIFSEMPSKVLCHDNCKGLCQFCGGNKNEMDCGCVRPANSIPTDSLNKGFIE